MSELQEWLGHPITQAIVKQLDDRIAIARQSLFEVSRVDRDVSVEFIGAQTVAILNEIDGLKWLKREIEDMKDEDSASR